MDFYLDDFLCDITCEEYYQTSSNNIQYFIMEDFYESI